MLNLVVSQCATLDINVFIMLLWILVATSLLLK